MLTFLYNIYLNFNKNGKKMNYFVFIIHQMNKLGVSRSWFTGTDIKHFNKNRAGNIPSILIWKTWIPSQVQFKDFVHRYRTAF